MITKWVVDALIASIDAIASLFPSFSIPSFTFDTSALSAVADLNRVFPVCTLILCIVSAVVLMAALSGWDFVVWIYHQFWGSD